MNGLFVVQNRNRGTVLGSNVRLADTPQSRRRGLLKRDGLEAEGVLQPPVRGLCVLVTE